MGNEGASTHWEVRDGSQRIRALTCEPVRTAEIAQKLRSIRGAIVREALGPYDFVVELEADTDEDLTAQLRHNIRTQLEERPSLVQLTNEPASSSASVRSVK